MGLYNCRIECLMTEFVHVFKLIGFSLVVFFDGVARPLKRQAVLNPLLCLLRVQWEFLIMNNR